MSRRYRVVHDLYDTGRPFIVQGDTTNSETAWSDVARFTTTDEANTYIDEVLTRHRALESDERSTRTA